MFRIYWFRVDNKLTLYSISSVSSGISRSAQHIWGKPAEDLRVQQEEDQRRGCWHKIYPHMRWRKSWPMTAVHQGWGKKNLLECYSVQEEGRMHSPGDPVGATFPWSQVRCSLLQPSRLIVWTPRYLSTFHAGLPQLFAEHLEHTTQGTRTCSRWPNTKQCSSVLAWTLAN